MYNDLVSFGFLRKIPLVPQLDQVSLSINTSTIQSSSPPNHFSIHQLPKKKFWHTTFGALTAQWQRFEVFFSRRGIFSSCGTLSAS